MTQYLLSMPHDSAEEPTMETMDPAELEAALAAARPATPASKDLGRCRISSVEAGR